MNTADDGVPLYRHVKRELIEAIAKGEFVHGEPFVTQREVCERFGVSTTTAARALNELVVEGLLVRRRGLGTFVNEETSRPPTTSGDRTIAYIGPYGWYVDGNGPHHTAIVSGIDSVCHELGFRLFITTSVESAADERRALQLALDTGAQGIVVYPFDGQDNGDVYAELGRRKIPVVMVDRYRQDLATDVVVPDNYEVGRQVTDHLVRAGHRRIATLWSDPGSTSVRDRLVGHLRALRDHDVPVSPQLTALRNYVGLDEERRRKLMSELLTSADPPTALLCVNGGVLTTAVHDLIMVDPTAVERISFAAMDDQAPYHLMPFSNVAAVLPSQKMGVRAMRMLADRIGGDHEADPQHVVLPIDLVVRDPLPGTILTGQRPRTS